MPLGGSCLCGAVTFEIDGRTSPIGQCHCSLCRKVSGTAGNSVMQTSARSFRWLSGTDNIRTFRVPPEQTWRSVFCGTCGSPLPLIGDDGKIVFVPAGLLDDDPGHRGYAAHIHVASKAPWVEITDDAPQFEEGFS